MDVEEAPAAAPETPAPPEKEEAPTSAPPSPQKQPHGELMLTRAEQAELPNLVADVAATDLERERLYAWRCVLRGLDAVAKGALDADAFETLLRDTVDRVVDWGHGAPKGRHLVNDVAMLCRKSSRVEPFSDWRDAAFALARRAAHPGRRYEVEGDDDPLLFSLVAKRPRRLARSDWRPSG